MRSLGSSLWSERLIWSYLKCLGIVPFAFKRCYRSKLLNWATVCDFQLSGILTSVYSDVPEQPPVKLRNSKCCSVSSLGVIEYSSDKQRLWSACAYAQADLRLYWSHIPHCWKSHVTAKLWSIIVPKDSFILVNSVEPDVTWYAAFHLGIHCLPKYSVLHCLRGIKHMHIHNSNVSL